MKNTKARVTFRITAYIILLVLIAIFVTAYAPSAVAQGDKNDTIMQHSEEQLLFSDKANAQFVLMEQAHIPDQYKYYAGCYIDNLQKLIINTTCKPVEFRTKYADLLDFSIIEVRQVKYSLKELELAYVPLYQEFTSSMKLNKLGIFGMAVFEQDNAIRIVVQSDNASIREEVASIITDTDMVVFEVDGKIIRY